MKLLCFADLHGDTVFLKRLVLRAGKEDIDLVVAAGDLTNFGDKLKYILNQLNRIGKPVLIIHGNHEDEEKLEAAVEECSNLVYLDKKEWRSGGYLFLGYGEGGFSVQDPKFRKIARRWYGEHQQEKIILVLHGPPFGTRADLIEKRHAGNKDFRSFIDRIKPKLVICGHLHETAGAVDQLGETKVVNPGWEGMVLELP